MKKSIPVLFTLFLTGCCFNRHQDISFSTNSLPEGVVGTEYYFKINTTRKIINMILVENSSSYTLNGLKIIALQGRNSAGDGVIIISGIPKKEGRFSFNVQVETVGTQCPGIQFDKKFDIIFVVKREDSNQKK